MAASTVAPPLDGYARRLVILFGLVYFSQGIGQHVGLVHQPLQFYFKEALGLNPAQVTEYLAVLTIPWMIKPLYGLVSDFIPLVGFKRKSWLLLTNMLATTGLLWLTSQTSPAAIVTALLMTAIGTAASDVIIDAIMVENGKKMGLTARFQSVQWLWISIASIVSHLLGGQLASRFTPGTALHIAATITLIAPIAVMVSSWLIVREEKSEMALSEMKATAGSLLEAFKSKTLWLVIAFLGFWNFSPSFGTPWYFHQTDTLKFEQDFIGLLGAVASAGSVLGAFAYWQVISKMPLRRQLVLAIVMGTIGTLLYLLLLTPHGFTKPLAIAIDFMLGAAAIMALLATLTLAAQACPPKAEGFTFAALMSVLNGFAQLAAIVGARLYTNVLDKSMAPLIIISALFTAACFLLLPLLRAVNIDAVPASESSAPPAHN
ncbi:MAG TPA: MFS transporter [Hyphomicrobiaceae bacterium]|nr:MFS transporter [Hyphomicrobiaceae bacterium]